MTIRDFLELKTVTLNEVETNFKEVKRIEVDTTREENHCYECGDSINQYQYPSEPWTKIFYCAKCRCINCIIFADRMGGPTLDVIIIYKDKQ